MHARTLTHKHTYTHKYIYIYIYMRIFIYAYIYIYIYIYISILPFIIIIIFPAHEDYVMRTRNSDLGRRSPGGGRVRCREYVAIKRRHIRSSGRTIYHDLLIRYRLYVAWTRDPVVEFRFLHTVVVGSISSGGDHGVHCWWDLMRSNSCSVLRMSRVGVCRILLSW